MAINGWVQTNIFHSECCRCSFPGMLILLFKWSWPATSELFILFTFVITATVPILTWQHHFCLCGEFFVLLVIVYAAITPIPVCWCYFCICGAGWLLASFCVLFVTVVMLRHKWCSLCISPTLYTLMQSFEVFRFMARCNNNNTTTVRAD